MKIRSVTTTEGKRVGGRGPAATLAAIALLGIVLHPGSGRGATIERERFLMGTRLRVVLEGSDPDRLQTAANRAFEEVARLETLLSNWNPDSELERMNRAARSAPVPVSEDLHAVLASGKRIAEETEGAFDPTIDPLVRAWDLRGKGRIPTKEERESAVRAVDHRALEVDPNGNTIRFGGDGMSVDLGGIGKGYALDRAARVLEREGIRSALLDFGGQFLAMGAPDGEEGWEIAIAHPQRRSEPIATVRLRNGSLSTSGQSERSVVIGDAPAGHILDPETGFPVAPWGSVSVVAPTATDADAFSTALFVLGPERGARWITAHGGIAAIFTSIGPTTNAQLVGTSPALLSFEAAPSAAGTSGVAPTPEELARRIDVLSEEVEEIKLGGVAEATSSKHGLGPAAAKVYQASRGVSIGGYGEAIYENFSDEREDDEPSGSKDTFDYLRSIVYLGYKYSPRILFNSEIEFEHASTERAGDVSVEFAYLDFLFEPRANARAGMVLLPVGFLNELHEPPIFFGAKRPETERVILPTTWRANGFGLFGSFPNGFSYRAYCTESLRSIADEDAGVEGFGAGGIRGGRQLGSESLFEDAALSGRVEWSGSVGLLLGASVVTGGTAQGEEDAGGEELEGKTTVYEAHAQFRRKGIHARFLYAGVTVDEVAELNEANGLTGDDSIGERGKGGYGEVAFDVLSVTSPGSRLALSPFVRYETVNTQDEVPTGFAADPANDRKIVTAGLSFHPHPQVVVKADRQWISNEAETGVDQWNAAVGFLF